LKTEEMIAILRKEWALEKEWDDLETEWKRIVGAVVDYLEWY
jgi:hypothetical protein